jgi:hypothetical protein
LHYSTPVRFQIMRQLNSEFGGAATLDAGTAVERPVLCRHRHADIT